MANAADDTRQPHDGHGLYRSLAWCPTAPSSSASASYGRPSKSCRELDAVDHPQRASFQVACAVLSRVESTSRARRSDVAWQGTAMPRRRSTPCAKCLLSHKLEADKRTAKLGQLISPHRLPSRLSGRPPGRRWSNWTPAPHSEPGEVR